MNNIYIFVTIIHFINKFFTNLFLKLVLLDL